MYVMVSNDLIIVPVITNIAGIHKRTLNYFPILEVLIPAQGKALNNLVSERMS